MTETVNSKFDLSSFDFAHGGCSFCHPGGGALEYDREGYRYDGRVSGLIEGPAGEDIFANPSPKNGDYFTFVSGSGIVSRVANWTSGGVAEADCLMCHYADQYTQTERNYGAIGAPMGGQTAPKLSASLGLVGKGTGDTGLLHIAQKAAGGNQPNVTGMSWLSDTIAADKILKAPTNSGCAVCHFMDKSWWADCAAAPTNANCGPAGKPFGAAAWQRLMPAGTIADGDAGAGTMNPIDWKVAKGKPEGGKRAESINDANNPDAHMDATSGNKTCSVCHYNLSGAFPAVMHGEDVIYPAITVQKIDHQFAKGDNLPDGKNMDQIDNTVKCAGCHIDATHPNAAGAPTPPHTGLPAVHLQKLDCRTCHIPVVNGPADWEIADFTVGPFRTFERNQTTENKLGVNAKPLYLWRKSSTSETIKLEPVSTTVVPVWTDNSPVKPTFQRAATAAAQARRTAALGGSIPGVTSWNLNAAQGGDTSLIVNTTEEITDMVSRVATASGVSTPVMNFYINTFDVSHNVMPKGGKCVDRSSVGQGTTCNYILGSTEGGGCVMCHSSSNPSSPGYSTQSVGFFDKTHKLFTNPTEDDTACGTTEGVVQTTAGGVRRVAVKLSTIKSDGTPNVIDLSDVDDCTPVGNTLNQGQVLGYSDERLAALKDLGNCAACHAQSLTAINHPMAPGTPSDCVACHTTQHTGAAFDVTVGCAGCHDGTPGPAFSTSALQAYAADMHSSSPAANFSTNVNYSASYTLDFNAAASVCPAGYSCSYSWDFDADSVEDAAGSNATETFAGTGPYPVTLTVTAAGGSSDSVTKNVSPVAINAAPNVCSSGLTQSGLAVSFTDCSTDDGAATVFVNWGDGKPVQSYAMGAVAGHTYTFASTYKIQHWVKDSAGLRESEAINVVVPSKVKLAVSVLGDGTGEAAGAPLGGALVRVYKAGLLKAQGYTAAATGTFTSAQVVEPGADVTMTISKTGKTFTCDPVAFASPAANPTAVACTY